MLLENLRCIRDYITLTYIIYKALRNIKIFLIEFFSYELVLIELEHFKQEFFYLFMGYFVYFLKVPIRSLYQCIVILYYEY
jgi:hypothetical protein